MTLHPVQIKLAKKWWNSIPAKKRIHYKAVMRLRNDADIAVYWMRQIASKNEADQVLQALKEHYGTN
jgi:hypothetical protein